MIFQSQTIAIVLSTDNDPACTRAVPVPLMPATTRIRSMTLVALNTFNGDDQETEIRHLASENDRSERDLLRRLDMETAGVTIVSQNPSRIRTILRLRTIMLLEQQHGEAELLHRQLSSARWTAACRAGVDIPGVAGQRERVIVMASAMLLDEVAAGLVTPAGRARFELTVEQITKSAVDADMAFLATAVPTLRRAALNL